MFISDLLVNHLIEEDMPYGDVTTEVMGIAHLPGVMEFKARYDCVLAGIEEAAAVLEKLGAKIEQHAAKGDHLKAGTPIMTARASAQILHAGWKVAQNIMEHACAIATRTHDMVSQGKAINPDLVIACTRKCFPTGKTISMNAIQAGGGTPHRLGLSETFLLFGNHSAFIDSHKQLLSALRQAVMLQPERKLVVECTDLEFARQAARCGAGVIQFDKVPAAQLKSWVPELKSEFPALKIAAAGGVNAKTVQDIAATGIDIVVTSSIYTGKPMDIEVKIYKDR